MGLLDSPSFKEILIEFSLLPVEFVFDLSLSYGYLYLFVVLFFQVFRYSNEHQYFEGFSPWLSQSTLALVMIPCN